MQTISLLSKYSAIDLQSPVHIDYTYASVPFALVCLRQRDAGGVRSEGEISQREERESKKEGGEELKRRERRGLMNAMQHPVGLVETNGPIMVDCNEPFAKFCGFVFPLCLFILFYFAIIISPSCFLVLFSPYIYILVLISIGAGTPQSTTPSGKRGPSTSSCSLRDGLGPKGVRPPLHSFPAFSVFSLFLPPLSLLSSSPSTGPLTFVMQISRAVDKARHAIPREVRQEK